MNEPLEELIRETLQAEKPPEISPFFASRVVNQTKINRQRNRFISPILALFWCVSSFFLIIFLTNFVWSGWIMLTIFVLVPISFLLTIFRNDVN